MKKTITEEAITILRDSKRKEARQLTALLKRLEAGSCDLSVTEKQAIKTVQKALAPSRRRRRKRKTMSQVKAQVKAQTVKRSSQSKANKLSFKAREYGSGHHATGFTKPNHQGKWRWSRLPQVKDGDIITLMFEDADVGKYPAVTAEVYRDGQLVTFRGKIMPLRTATDILLVEMGKSLGHRGDYGPRYYWSHNGHRLAAYAITPKAKRGKESPLSRARRVLNMSDREAYLKFRGMSLDALKPIAAAPPTFDPPKITQSIMMDNVKDVVQNPPPPATTVKILIESRTQEQIDSIKGVEDIHASSAADCPQLAVDADGNVLKATDGRPWDFNTLVSELMTGAKIHWTTF